MDAAVAILRDYLSSVLPDFTFQILHWVKTAFTFAVVVIIFAGLFKFLPDVKIRWKVTWIGAFLTAILFAIGKWLIGLGLTQSNISSMYGAAGSVVMLLLWVFYSALIFFFGAEITRQYAKHFSHTIQPKRQAVAFEIIERESDNTEETARI
jgi:membrane protein